MDYIMWKADFRKDKVFLSNIKLLGKLIMLVRKKLVDELKKEV
jgi:hypothetical protein